MTILYSVLSRAQTNQALFFYAHCLAQSSYSSFLFCAEFSIVLYTITDRDPANHLFLCLSCSSMSVCAIFLSHKSDPASLYLCSAFSTCSVEHTRSDLRSILDVHRASEVPSGLHLAQSRVTPNRAVDQLCMARQADLPALSLKESMPEVSTA